MLKPRQEQVADSATDPRPPFFDDEEREIVESFESAIDSGKYSGNTPEDLAEAKSRWTTIVKASRICNITNELGSAD